MKRVLTVGSRDSKLAVAQTQIVIKELQRVSPELEIQLATFKTTGDRILDKTLDQVGGKGLFVKELDEALLKGKIDFAVHSLKDLPMETHPDLPIVACLRRGDPRDALVRPANMETPVTIIGTSSARRRLQVSSLFPKASCRSVRGNINTRLEKLDRGEYSALILAAAGLIRAGVEERISRYFSPEEIIPAAGQGILAVQCCRDFDGKEIFRLLNHRETEWAALAERGFVRALDGGCSAPTAAYARLSGNELVLTGFYADVSGTFQVKGTLTGPADHAEKIGVCLAERLRKEIK